jgi:hypothetical protein
MAKQTKANYKPQSAVQIINDWREKTKKTRLTYIWEKIAYFLSGEMLLYQSKEGRWFPIKSGIPLPGVPEGVTEQSLTDYPKDPHMITLSNGITAKALGNPLMPQATPFSTSDEDKESARKVTNFLMYYRAVNNEDRQSEGESMREEIIELFKYYGCAFIKTYFDKSIGDMVPDVDEEGNQIIVNGRQVMRRRGDIKAEVINPENIGIQNGVKRWRDITGIIYSVAMHIDDIYKKYKVRVEPDSDLEDTRDRTAWGVAQEDNGKKLENHAVVYEVYLKPCEEYELGRMVVGTKDVELFDGLYDRKLAESDYRDTDWHPFSFAGWLKSPRNFWPDTPFRHLIPHQANLNKQWKRLLEDDKDFKGWWLNVKGSVDWDMVRTSAVQDGTPNIQYEEGYEQPQFIEPPIKNQDAIGKINLTVARMNDIIAQYETTRGNSDPNIKSGIQADIMNSSSNTQATPLLTAIVSLYMAHWKKEIHIGATHFNDEGGPREVRFQDPITDEIINDTFSPEDIKSDDITLFGGNAFYMTPEAKEQQLDKLLEIGAFGDISTNDKMRLAYLKQRGVFVPESSYDPNYHDRQMAEWENARFKNGQFEEDRQYIVDALIKEFADAEAAYEQAAQMYQEDMENWQTMKEEFDAMSGPYQLALAEQAEASKKGMPAEHPGQAPIDPGMEPEPPGEPPQEPEPWWRARLIENAAAHMDVHIDFMNSPDYYKLCKKYPDLDTAMNFHLMDHIRKEAEYQRAQQDIVMAILPPPEQPIPEQQ